MGKAVRIGYAGVVLEGVEGGIGEAAAVFHNRREAESRRQTDDAPGQKTVGKAGGEVGDLVGAGDGGRETTEVVIEIVEVAAGAAVDIREAQLAGLTLQLIAGGGFDLAVAGITGAGEEVAAGGGGEVGAFGGDGDEAIGIVLGIADAEFEIVSEGLFDLEGPDIALGREIAGHGSLKDEFVMAKDFAEGVLEEERPGRDCAIGVVVCEDLAGVAGESVDVQGDAVVEPAEAGVHDGGGAGEGRPGNADAGGEAEGFGEFLRLGAHAEIQGQTGSEDPVIMGEEGVAEIRYFEWQSGSEGDALDQLAGCVEDVDGVFGDRPVLVVVGEIGSDFEVVSTQVVNGFGGNGGAAGEAGGLAALLREIIAAVAGGSEDEIGGALAPDGGVEAGDGEDGFEQAADDGEAVGEGAGVVVGTGVGGGGLGVEVVDVDESQALGSDMDRGRDKVLVRDHPVELSKGVNALLPLQVEGEGQGVDGSFADLVIDAFGEIEFAGDEGAFEIETGGSVAETAQVPTADEEFGEWIVQFPLPFFAAAAGFNGNQAGRKAPVLGQKGGLVNVDGFDAIDGDGEAELAGGRVGDVGGVDDHGAAVFGGGGDHEASPWFANHSGNHGEGVGNGGGLAGKILGVNRGEGGGSGGHLFDGRGGAFDFDGFAVGDGGDEGQFEGDGGVGGEREIGLASDFEIGFGGRDFIASGLESGERGMALGIGLGV